MEIDGIAPVDFAYNNAGAANGLLRSVIRTHGATTRQIDPTWTNGYLTSSRAYLNNVWKRDIGFSVDAFGRRTYVGARLVEQGGSEEERLGIITYDKNGNATRVGNHFQAFTLLNQLKKFTAPLPAQGGSEAQTSFTFTDDRLPATDTHPDANVTVTRGYDSAGRLASITMPSGTTYYDYYSSTASSPGKVSKVRGPYGVDLALDYYGNLPKSQTWSGTVSGAVSRTYDSDFYPITESVAIGSSTVTLTRAYDDDKLLTCVSTGSCAASDQNALSIAREQKNGLVKTVTLGKVVETYSYNGFGELARKTSTYDGTPLLDLTYDAASAERDVLGNVTKFTEKVGTGASSTYEYKYDHTGALTDVLKGAATLEHYTYSSTQGHNRSSATTPAGTVSNITVDLRDRLTAYGNLTFTYSEKGDLKTRTNTATSQTTTYTYDALGNLRTVALPTKTVEYTIDGRGRRVERKVGAAVKRWLYRNAVHPVAELDASGALVSTFVYGSSESVPDYMVRGGKTYRILSDQLGSVRMVVNVANSSDIPFKATYSAFGEPTITVVAPATVDFLPFGFAGGIYDADTGLVRFGARDYDPSVGRWTSKDPILFRGQQFNLYAYLNSDPVNRRDPFGLWGCAADAQDIKDLKDQKDLETEECRNVSNSGGTGSVLPFGESSRPDGAQQKIDKCHQEQKQYAEDSKDYTEEESRPWDPIVDFFEWLWPD